MSKTVTREAARLAVAIVDDMGLANSRIERMAIGEDRKRLPPDAAENGMLGIYDWAVDLAELFCKKIPADFPFDGVFEYEVGAFVASLVKSRKILKMRNAEIVDAWITEQARHALSRSLK